MGVRLYNSGIRKWTPEEDARLRDLWPQHSTVIAVAERFHGRTMGAVSARGVMLGLPSKGFGWTEADDAILREHWKKGLSGAQIAAKYFPEKSRSAIIGRAHRLGLCERRSSWLVQKRIKARVKPQKPASVKPPKPKQTPLKALLSALPDEPLPPVDTMPAQVSFNNLLDHHCRAITVEHLPFNADAKIYCGERKVPGAAYCEHHARRYFNTPELAKYPSWTPKTVGAPAFGREVLKNAEEFTQA